MSDSAHAAFIRDCRDERKALIIRIEAMSGDAPEADMLAVLPARADETAAQGVARLKQAIAFLDNLISEYETRLGDTYLGSNQEAS
jgi:hypothetical protein